jgi:hypothetical protein
MAGLIVGEGRKTLSALYRQWVDAPDVSAVADFFRASPWSEGEVIFERLRVEKMILHWLPLHMKLR